MRCTTRHTHLFTTSVCKRSCRSNTKDWAKKCSFTKTCGGCPECSGKWHCFRACVRSLREIVAGFRRKGEGRVADCSRIHDRNCTWLFAGVTTQHDTAGLSSKKLLLCHRISTPPSAAHSSQHNRSPSFTLHLLRTFIRLYVRHFPDAFSRLQN